MIDISMLIAPETAVIPGDDAIQMTTLCDIGDEAPCRITTVENFTTHLLTHIDAPRHFIATGRTMDQIDLDRFMPLALVVEVGSEQAVDIDAIPDDDLQGKAVLFKTRNSQFSTTVYHEDHAYLTAGAATELVRRGASLVGIDYLTIDREGDEDYPVHRTLLAEDVLILEGLRLSSAQPGWYRLSALPLSLGAADGSPVRAVLYDI